jgi:hypothetical protein
MCICCKTNQKQNQTPRNHVGPGRGASCSRPPTDSVMMAMRAFLQPIVRSCVSDTLADIGHSGQDVPTPMTNGHALRW